MSRRPNARPNGQVRRSQVITTFGPGALLELPNHSVIIGGLDQWEGVGDEIHEPRLVDKARRVLEVDTLRLFGPPPDGELPGAPRTGITAWQFPEWFITQDVERDRRDELVRSRLLVHRKFLTRGEFIDVNKRRRPVVPVRFVRACRRGHIGDIDWRGFVHTGQAGCPRQLWFDERGTTGDLSEIQVRCECGAWRPIGEAANLARRRWATARVPARGWACPRRASPAASRTACWCAPPVTPTSRAC